MKCAEVAVQSNSLWRLSSGGAVGLRPSTLLGTLARRLGEGKYTGLHRLESGANVLGCAVPHIPARPARLRARPKHQPGYHPMAMLALFLYSGFLVGGVCLA